MTYRENLERVHHRAKPKLRTYRIADRINAFFPKLYNATALDADEVVVVGHSAAELERRTFSVESVFHQNAALGKQIQCGVDRGPGNPVTSAIHVDIELVGTKMSVKFCNSIEHEEPLLGATILLALEEICKRGFERIDVLRWSHGHKYICA